jgi:hypothetical protein
LFIHPLGIKFDFLSDEKVPLLRRGDPRRSDQMQTLRRVSRWIDATADSLKQSSVVFSDMGENSK